MSPRNRGLIVAVLATIAGPTWGQDPDEAANPGEQVLTRGPIHEAFAGPVVYDPKPGPIIAKPPPEPIQELPPDQKPEGANVEWISGYWAWDDTRADYLWISGVYRNIPPGRQWAPGYWHEEQGGVQWVPGVWMAVQSASAQYLAAPPSSLESGPNSPAPTPDSIWAPGSWIWQEPQYYWRPGFWITPQPNWVWIPAQYVWTPSGYLFTEGYWDRPIATRGQMFAPVYYSQPVYLQPNYVYQPTIGIVASGLMLSLFVRPSCHAYYFGDYYAPSYVGVGIYPWYSYHQTRYGYDPLYSYYSVNYRYSNPGWHTQIREEYAYRRDHIEARPAHTYVEMNRISQTNVTVNHITVNNVRNVSFAQPISRIAASNNPAVAPMRFERIAAAEQRQQIHQAQQLRTFQHERVQRESVAMRNHPTGEPMRPRTVELPKSPISRVAPAARPIGHNEAFARPVAHAEAFAPHHTPPAQPVHPKFDHTVQPSTPAHLNPRPESRFEAHQAQQNTSHFAPVPHQQHQPHDLPHPASAPHPVPVQRHEPPAPRHEPAKSGHKR